MCFVTCLAALSDRNLLQLSNSNEFYQLHTVETDYGDHSVSLFQLCKSIPVFVGIGSSFLESSQTFLIMSSFI